MYAQAYKYPVLAEPTLPGKSGETLVHAEASLVAVLAGLWTASTSCSAVLNAVTIRVR